MSPLFSSSDTISFYVVVRYRRYGPILLSGIIRVHQKLVHNGRRTEPIWRNVKAWLVYEQEQVESLLGNLVCYYVSFMEFYGGMDWVS